MPRSWRDGIGGFGGCPRDPYKRFHSMPSLLQQTTQPSTLIPRLPTRLRRCCLSYAYVQGQFAIDYDQRLRKRPRTDEPAEPRRSQPPSTHRNDPASPSASGRREMRRLLRWEQEQRANLEKMTVEGPQAQGIMKKVALCVQRSKALIEGMGNEMKDEDEWLDNDCREVEAVDKWIKDSDADFHEAERSYWESREAFVAQKDALMGELHRLRGSQTSDLKPTNPSIGGASLK